MAFAMIIKTHYNEHQKQRIDNIMNAITSNQLDALIQVNAVKSITVSGTSGGFIVKVNDTYIEAQRGHTRKFKKLNSVAVFLKSKGLGNFNVDISQWSQDQNPLQ